MDTPQPDARCPPRPPARRRLSEPGACSTPTGGCKNGPLRARPRIDSFRGWSFVAGTEPEEELRVIGEKGVVDIDVVAQVDRESPSSPGASAPWWSGMGRACLVLRVVHEPEVCPRSLMMPIPAGRAPAQEAWAGQTRPADAAHGGRRPRWRDGLTLWIAAFFGGAEVEDRIQEIADGIEGEVTSMTRRVTATYGSLFYEREGADQTVRYAFAPDPPAGACTSPPPTPTRAARWTAVPARQPVRPSFAHAGHLSNATTRGTQCFSTFLPPRTTRRRTLG